MGNNQMLAADPTSKEIRRFLVGPSGCEITGVTWTPDRKTMFVNVQHPGEVGSHPNAPKNAGGSTLTDNEIARNATAFLAMADNKGERPRSATVVVRRDRRRRDRRLTRPGPLTCRKKSRPAGRLLFAPSR
jgi:secreted PhoX family phosphatase